MQRTLKKLHLFIQKTSLDKGSHCLSVFVQPGYNRDTLTKAFKITFARMHPKTP